MTVPIDESPADDQPIEPGLGPFEPFWRNRLFARIRHHLTWMRRASPLLTRAHATAIRLSGGRIWRSFSFTGGMPILVLTTVGRKSGQTRSTAPRPDGSTCRPSPAPRFSPTVPVSR
jgi:F420H(2)-dependent quinone reductase